MRSPLGTLLNRAPIPYVGRTSLAIPFRNPSGAEAEMAAMGANGTLFSIVNRTSNAAAQVDWKLWRKAASGKKEDRTEVTNHAALNLLNKPNPFFTRQELIEVTQQHIDLTGEGWWVIGRDPRSTLPLELWPVRPDRMEPVPSATNYLAGYWYTGPDGEKVPLGLEDVIFIRMPNPLDPYRGMGPVQTALVDLDAERFSAEWNRNFFRNGAEPGGILEIEGRLSDTEFDEHRERWAEQHKGVANAHRVALLEGGMKWVDRKYTQRDMEFSSLRAVSTQKIREAFGVPKFAVGDVDDVNRATADASKAWFAEQLTTPRLGRFKGALNNDLLPLFGRNAADQLEFDHENPVPPDAEAENEARSSKVGAAVQLVSAGWDPAEALDAVGLPAMTFVGEGDDGGAAHGARSLSLAEMVQKLYLGVNTIITWEEGRAMLVEAGAPLDLDVPPPTAPAPTAPDEPAEPPVEPTPEGPAPESEPEPEPIPTGRRSTPSENLGAIVRDVIRAATEDEEREDWEDRLDDLLVAWVAVSAAQRAELAEQITDIVKRGTPAELAALTASSADAAALIAEATLAQAEAAAGRAVKDAADQGVKLSPPSTADLSTDLTAAGIVTAALLASGLAAAAGREALRIWAPGDTGIDVARKVTAHLETLTDGALRVELSSALWAAENEGRFATLEKAVLNGKAASYYEASEQRDANRCPPCAAIDGTRFATLPEAQAQYPFGGYQHCDGRGRCRGTVHAVWE